MTKYRVSGFELKDIVDAFAAGMEFERKNMTPIPKTEGEKIRNWAVQGCNAVFDAEAKSPTFDRFLDTITEGMTPEQRQAAEDGFREDLAAELLLSRRNVGEQGLIGDQPVEDGGGVVPELVEQSIIGGGSDTVSRESSLNDPKHSSLGNVGEHFTKDLSDNLAVSHCEEL